MTLEEIRQWNKRLKDCFKGIHFDEPSHKYTIEGFEDRPIKSVSALMKYFYDEFNTDMMARQYAKSRGLDWKDVKLAWEGEGTISTTHGTKVHLFGEDYIKWKWLGELDNPPVVFDKQSLGVKEFLDSLPDHFVPVASELQMYDPENWYCGTADIIALNTKTSRLSVLDFKGLHVDTPILTTKGFKRMGDLEVGEKVYDPEGIPTTIKNVSSIKSKKCYKIKFDNNSEVIADFEHRWKVFTQHSTGKKYVILTTEELFNHLKRNPKGLRKSVDILKIDKPKPIQNNSVTTYPFKMDFWLLGLWFADGNRNVPTICKKDDNVWNEVLNRGFKISIDHSRNYPDKCRSHTVYGLGEILKYFKVIKNKHLPDELLTNTSYKERLELLQGFMDGDGYYNNTRNRFVIDTTQKWMVDFSVKLLSSLGVKATVLSYKMKYNGENKQAWCINFTTTDFSPFYVRKVECKPLKKLHNAFLKIEEVEEIGECLTKCIEVDSKSHMFLCGIELIPTHNTNKEIVGGKYATKKLKLKNNEHNLIQDSFGKYSIQFSLYQLMLMRHGFEFDTRVLIHLTDNQEEKKLYKTYRTPDLTKELDEWLQTKEHLK